MVIFSAAARLARQLNLLQQLTLYMRLFFNIT